MSEKNPIPKFVALSKTRPQIPSRRQKLQKSFRPLFAAMRMRSVLADKANATYKNGVLKLKLPKATPGEPKSVTVNVD